ncbi:cytochrome P450 [Streptomyces mirabilis]|uniref:cytochrome P450 n=1 Tax=Streptomyces sp. NPDC005388 TaxID=3156717 RepID=UPI0033B46A7C
MACPAHLPPPRHEPFRPTPQYEQWREEHPLKQVRLPNGQEPWVVLRHEEARAVLGQTDHLSSDATRPGFPLFRAGKPTGTSTNQLTRMDPPLHGTFRKIFAPFFTPKRIRQWTPQLKQFLTEGAEAMLAAGAPADFHNDLALTIPSKAICLLLGMDYSLHTEFERLTRPVASALVTAEERDTATAELFALMEEAFRTAREHPRDGVIAVLLDLVDREEISYEAAVSNTFSILIGGHETTAHTISLGTIQLLERPDLRRAVAAAPEKLPILVEEMLRTQAVAESVIARAVTKPLRIGDTVLEPGDGIVVPASSANHDPRAFPNPHEIDLGRDLSKGHLAFGAGIHSCLGQALARAELQIVFGSLFELIPTLRLIPEQPVEYQRDPFIFGIKRLPVAW